jgi:allophanate hydrolase
MRRSVLVVEYAGPSVTIQDAGRHGRMRLGVPASGPMDPFAHRIANAVLGRRASNTAIEVSVGGLALRCHESPVTVAVCGGSFVVHHDGRRCPRWVVVTLRPGEPLVIEAGTWGSWCTLAFAGDLVARRWMGSTSTHFRSGLGGGVVHTGDELEVASPVADPIRDGAVDVPRRARPPSELRAVLGPQDGRFTRRAIDAFWSARFVVTSVYDRMGARLDGPELEVVDALDIASAPVVRGSVQVNGDGIATVLHADHQTVGGYPRIATVIGPDAERAAQLRPGEAVRFRPVTPGEAVAAARTDAELTARHVAALADRPGLRSRRLFDHNLVGGVIDASSASGT